MKLFKTNNIETVKACQEFFGFQLLGIQLSKRNLKSNSMKVHHVQRSCDILAFIHGSTPLYMHV